MTWIQSGFGSDPKLYRPFVQKIVIRLKKVINVVAGGLFCKNNFNV